MVVCYIWMWLLELNQPVCSWTHSVMYGCVGLDEFVSVSVCKCLHHYGCVLHMDVASRVEPTCVCVRACVCVYSSHTHMSVQFCHITVYHQSLFSLLRL